VGCRDKRRAGPRDAVGGPGSGCRVRLHPSPSRFRQTLRNKSWHGNGNPVCETKLVSSTRRPWSPVGGENSGEDTTSETTTAATRSLARASVKEGEPPTLPRSGVLPGFGKGPLLARILVTSASRTDEREMAENRKEAGILRVPGNPVERPPPTTNQRRESEVCGLRRLDRLHHQMQGSTSCSLASPSGHKKRLPCFFSLSPDC
jgi:hypothetical protein